VDSFFARRFGKKLAEEMISAMIHGIYSGDTRRLSIRAVFPGLWDAEKQWGSVILSMLFGRFGRKSAYKEKVESDMRLCEGIKGEVGAIDGELVRRMEEASVWGLKGGLEVLTEGLADWARREGVAFRMGKEGEVRGVQRTEEGWLVRNFLIPLPLRLKG